MSAIRPSIESLDGTMRSPRTLTMPAHRRRRPGRPRTANGEAQPCGLAGSWPVTTGLLVLELLDSGRSPRCILFGIALGLRLGLVTGACAARRPAGPSD